MDKELGARLRAARLASGLSQRQLCGEVITRNMLSLIENGSASPSMDTLRYLAGRLGKPVGFFLAEEAAASPNQGRMAAARAAYAGGKPREVLRILADYQSPDQVFDQEKDLLLALSLMAAAEAAIAQGKAPYAAALLDRAEQTGSLYWSPALERQRLLLLAQTRQRAGLAALLPKDDRELLLRGEEALEGGDPAACGRLLDAAWDREGPAWNFLRGRAFLELGDYAPAAACLHKAEEAFPQKTAQLLERCYRELEDYKMAYFYACRQRENR